MTDTQQAPIQTKTIRGQRARGCYCQRSSGVDRDAMAIRHPQHALVGTAVNDLPVSTTMQWPSVATRKLQVPNDLHGRMNNGRTGLLEHNDGGTASENTK